jgi:hypothetical protein
VIQGGTLIDGTGRAPIRNSVIVIEGNRIKASVARMERSAIRVSGTTSKQPRIALRFIRATAY